ncbi:MAG: alpha/beta hydrolase [Alphaproteobacteria bacterium]|nr:alpha/beta hydrolase [Alphaproteobacteria bacterium]
MGTRIIAGLHVQICGHGPPVLLIHGFGASGFTWSKIISRLSGDHRIIVLDLKGFGRSRKPRDGHYSLRDQAAAVIAVIDALGLDGFAMVGHSLGGGVALLTALLLEQQAPGRLGRLALLDTIAYRQPLPYFIKLLRVPVFGELITFLLPKKWMVRRVLGFAYFDRAKIEYAFVKEYARPLLCGAGRAALVAAARALIPPDVDELASRYSTIAVPVQLLAGCEDRIVPLAAIRRLAGAIPSARLCILDCCGHVPQEEQPDATVSILHEFLAEPAVGHRGVKPASDTSS